MTYSTEWDDRYRNNEHLSIWPWSDLVSYVMKYTDIKTRKLDVLELGCGAGANISLFLNLKANYYAIESSQHIVDKLRKTFPSKIGNNIQQGDFTHDIPFNRRFDLIIDRASVSHNKTVDIKNCLRLCKESLKDGGKFIGIEWFSDDLPVLSGTSVDKETMTNFTEGPFANVGMVHFSSRKHIESLFELELLEKKRWERHIPATIKPIIILDYWNFIGTPK